MLAELEDDGVKRNAIERVRIISEPSKNIRTVLQVVIKGIKKKNKQSIKQPKSLHQYFFTESFLTSKISGSEFALAPERMVFR